MLGRAVAEFLGKVGQRLTVRVDRLGPVRLHRLVAGHQQPAIRAHLLHHDLRGVIPERRAPAQRQARQYDQDAKVHLPDPKMPATPSIVAR